LSLTAMMPVQRVHASTVVQYSLQGLEPVPEPTHHNTKSLRVRDGYVYFSYVRGYVANGIARFDPSRGSMTFHDLPMPSDNYVVSFDLDDEGVWILTSDPSRTRYLRWLNLTDGRVISWLVAEREWGMGTNGMTVENDHSIWLTGESLMHFNPVSGEMKTYPLPTNFTTIFKPIWSYGKVWATAMRGYPLPSYMGDALMMFDARSEIMIFYDLPSYGFRSAEFVNDIAADYHGNLWLMSPNRLARFDIASKELTIIQSAYGGAPGACDKEGNVYFVDWEYLVGLAGFSPSDQTFTEYWRAPQTISQIQDVAVDGDGNVWFIYTFTSGQTRGMELYKLSRGGMGYTVTLTSTLSSERTSMNAIPSAMLTQTSSTAIATQTQRSTAMVLRSQSVLTATSSTVLTETRVVDEFSTFTSLVLLVAILIPALARRRKRSPEGNANNHSVQPNLLSTDCADAGRERSGMAKELSATALIGCSGTAGSKSDADLGMFPQGMRLLIAVCGHGSAVRRGG